MPTNDIQTDVTTSITIPRVLRVRLDEARLARARRLGRLSPPLKAVVIEALEKLLECEPRS